MSTRALHESWAEPVATAFLEATGPATKDRLIKALADLIEKMEEHHLNAWHNDEP